MYVILVLLLYYLPESKKWISAKDLVVGDTILLSSGNKTEVEAIRAIHYDEAQTTYNKLANSEFVKKGIIKALDYVKKMGWKL